MTQFAARVLYTRHVQKKRKTWQDGYLAVNPQDSYNRTGKLYDEEGKLIASSRIPGSQTIDAESEGGVVARWTHPVSVTKLAYTLL